MKSPRWGGAFLPPDTHGQALFPARASSAPFIVNRSLHVPTFFRNFYDQDGTGMCSSFAVCQAITLHNGRYYDPAWLFGRGAEITGVGDPTPQLHARGRRGDGTTPDLCRADREGPLI